MTTVLPNLSFHVGDMVRLKSYYGGSKPLVIVDKGPCSKWATKYPYQHECDSNVSLLINDGQKNIRVHEDMVEAVE